MTTLEININDIRNEQIDIDSLKRELPDDTELIVYGLGKKFKGYGHFEIYIDCKLNGEYMLLSKVTTDTLTIDKFWTDVFSEEDFQDQADAASNLISQIIRSNENIILHGK